MPDKKSITILHLSDVQFGANHRFGVDVETDEGKIDTLLGRITDDLKEMKDDFSLKPEVIVLTGDIAELGMRSEYNEFREFIDGVIEFIRLDRSKVVLVPGNHDVNRALCESYFTQCEGNEEGIKEPYYKKWERFKKFFDEFYKDCPDIAFTQDHPWSLFRYEDLNLVVAGLNSTMKESHQVDDHYGWCGESQYRWFKDELKKYEKERWFRIGVIHHNVRRSAVEDDANLHDEGDFKRYLSETLNLILHGHVHQGDMDWLTNQCPILAAGSASLKEEKRPKEVPNQYQIIQIEKDKISRWCRAYSYQQKKWIGDNLPIIGGNDWKQEKSVSFKNTFFLINKTRKKNKNTYGTYPEKNLEEEIKTYCQKAEALHETLPVAGFATQIKVPINIEEIHVPLHAMVDLSGLKRKKYADSSHAEEYLKARDAGIEIFLLDAFKKVKKRANYKGIVILGDPGSGKTTHLKRVLLWCVREKPEILGLPKNMLPVFLPLRDLVNLDQGMDVFIQDQLTSPHLDTPEDFGERLLKRGNLLFLLDGLDEVSDLSKREQVAGWIIGALTSYPSCRFIVTCRFAGYSDTVRLSEKFLEMHIRPFTKEQADEFIHNWYRIVEKGLAKDPDMAETIGKENADDLILELQKPNFRSSRVFELTRNPLLLTNICLVHRFRAKLPESRAELYKECIDVLLQYWPDAKKLQNVRARDGCRILQPAALWLHEKDKRTRATAKELSPHIEPALKAVKWPNGGAKDFLRTIRDESGLLTGWDQENYGFMHLGFQEYLAAREIRIRAFEDESVLRDLALRFGESWWKEVGLLMLALEEPSFFKPYMREVVKLPAFLKHTDLVDACLTDAAEISVEPFIELLKIPPGKKKELWKRQLYALKIAERINADAIGKVKQKLAKHPYDDIRNWITGKAEQAKQDVILASRGGYELVRIPGDSFMMGSSEKEEGHYKDEAPLHKVQVPDFYIGRYPVTNKEYGLFLNENSGMREPEYWADRRFNQPGQPVVGVSWDDAKKYAEWADLRLPTEAEWEYACRAGTATRYYTGNSEKDLDRAGWYHSNSGGQLHPVGEKEPNSFGLYDMHGNVWEWVEDDWHENYKGAPADGSAWAWVGKRGGSNRVMRGGSWFSSALNCRSAYRNDSSDLRNYVLGFRLSRSVPLGY